MLSIYARIYDENGVDMAEKAVNNGQNNEVPCGIRQRLDYNADFRLDWHDPDEATDGYQLKWIGKDYARFQFGTFPNTIVKPDVKHNSQPQNQNSQNIFITGDNLQALKHLQSAYRGQVDMIYIDPPYNTGGDGFVYNDKFEFSDEVLMDKLNLTEEQIKRLHVINGRSSHSAWLTFMYPRLRLAKELLKDTGVIFISIDDNEQANLKLLCDEIFGERNFVVAFPWRKRTAKSDVPCGVSQDYEYILCYVRGTNFLASVQGNSRKYFMTSDFPNRPWRYHDMSTQRTAGERPNSNFTIINPKNGQQFPVNPQAVWRITKQDFQSYLDKNRIIFPGDYAFLKITKPVLRYWKQDDMEKDGAHFGRKTVSTKLPDNVGRTEDGTADLRSIFGYSPFPFPKPVNLIKYLIEIINNKSALIMDFFAGSATTAHAVMQINKEDGGTRRYIMAQLDEPTWESEKNGNKTAKEGSEEAFKAGFMSIDQIGRQRIKNAAKQIGDTTGFKHFYVRSPDTAALSKITEFNPDNPNVDKLFTEDIVRKLGGTDVILQTWMAADGYMLTDIPQEIDIAGYKAYYCGNSVLYLIENGWQQANTKALLNLIGGNKINVNTIICCAYSFTFESMSELETNIRQSLSEISVEKRY